LLHELWEFSRIIRDDNPIGLSGFGNLHAAL
jgi:hypothetical protein